MDDAVLQIFASVSKRQRERLLRIFDQLVKDPFIKADSRQLDNTGRQCNVNRFGEWLVIWWPEHLADQIHIIDLEHLRM